MTANAAPPPLALVPTPADPTTTGPTDSADRSETSTGPDPRRSPDRATLEADLELLSAWIQTSARFPSLDRLVALLTGRSLVQRLSACCSTVTRLSDDELELVLGFVLEHAAAYLGLAEGPPPPGPDERAALARAVEHFIAELRADPRWSGGSTNPIVARFLGAAVR